MMSFYIRTPSSFQVEYGYGGRVIDDDVWEVQLHHAPSIWGHRSPDAAPRAAVPETA
jgi:3,4-dihydroxy-9,10-secoandrosta-1,3,5(10)-triene-9,17-dione 4,5-dioxygenase